MNYSLLIILFSVLFSEDSFADSKILVPEGEYASPFGQDKAIKIRSFFIDKFPSTIGSSKTAKTNVSWFEASADCQSKGGRLPTTVEWEYAASFKSDMDESKLIERYSRPTSKTFEVGKTKSNKLGIGDLYGLVWEWTEDFNSLSITSKDDRFFCGGALVQAKDPNQYATFMRFAYRSSLKATYEAKNLGYRCVYEQDSVSKSQSVVSAGPYQINATWVKSTGEKIKTNELSGKVRVLAMIYTRCKMTCPIVTSYMRQLERELPTDIKGRVRFTLVSFDTDSDKANQLSEFMKTYSLSNESWDVIVGEKQGTRQFAQFLEVAYKEKSDGSFDHSGVISILDENGKILTQVQPSELSRTTLAKALHGP
jgi:cytochrome oxidase Cu insertion factor (SCO1/SenC/PrrC family)